MEQDELMLFNEEHDLAIEKRKKFESNLANIWGYSQVGLEAKTAAASLQNMKTGMFARVPITCKTENCPYAKTCPLLQAELAPYGEKCPMETSMIEARYVGYSSDCDLDNASYTDMILLGELINLDIMLERCKALLSANETPIEQVIAGITENGQEFTRPEISKAWEIYERTLNKKDKLLDTMMMTKKSKKGTELGNTSINDILMEAVSQEFIIEEIPDEYK